MYPNPESSEWGLPGSAAPFVSIVTVSLNAAATIEDTIVSVLMQQTGFAVRKQEICDDGQQDDVYDELRNGNALRVVSHCRGCSLDRLNLGIFREMARMIEYSKLEMSLLPFLVI